MGKIIGIISEVLIVSFSVVGMLFAIVFAYLSGYNHGVVSATGEYQSALAKFIQNYTDYQLPTPAPQQEKQTSSAPRSVAWGGPDLWQAVNNKRVEYGVQPLNQADELCTIASIRLNELLELGKLDGHEGFSNLPERRPDLKWIFEKYVVAEFLAFGGESAQETVDMWDNTLAHKKLLTGGEYVWGCTYAQSSFAVAIAGYQ